MKRIISFLLSLCMVLSSFPLCGSDTPPSESDLYANAKTTECEPLGSGSKESSHTGVSISMLGWGLGLAIAIAILAGVIHQSSSSHNNSKSSTQ